MTDLRPALDQDAIVAVADAQGVILFVNDRFCALSKYSREELVGENFRILNSGYHAPDLFREMWATISNGGVWRGELRNRAKDGTFFWIDSTIAPFRDDDGQPRQYIAIQIDITGRKLAENRLHESETRTRPAIEAAGGVDRDITDRERAEEDLRKSHLLMAHAAQAARLTYAYLDLATGRFDVASNYCEVMGYSVETPREGATASLAIGNLLKHIHPDDRPHIQGALNAFLAGKLTGSAQCRICADDGGERWVEGTWSAEAGPDGKPKLLILTSLDVTALVAGKIALEAAKAEAERANQAKSKFLAAASHDLRQPVQSLVLLLDVVERQAASLPAAKRAAGLMRTAVDSLQALLDAVLDISRLEAGVVDPKAETVDLGLLLLALEDEYVPRVASKGLDLRSSPRRLFVRTDPNLLGRILRNLIENALRYTSKGGILIGVRRRGQWARIDIFDTGIGIPAEKKSEIFEEFRQLHNPGRNFEKGLGLGLAIVKQIASLLGAQIEVASKVGRGSRFSVFLPLVEISFVSNVAPTLTEIKDSGGRVLIVEDNAIVRGSLEAMLSEWGYQTRSAGSGEDALVLAAEDDWRYEALILDYQLGEGLTGVETAREFERKAARPFAILILTGETTKERIAELDASGFEMLYKPIAASDLRQKLVRLIDDLGAAT